MKVLWCTTSMESVFAFGLPIAEAMRDAGHEVVLATGPDFVGRAEAEGFAAMPAGPSAMEGAIAAMQDPAVTAAPADESWHFAVAMFGRAVAPAKYPALEAIADRWQPDLVLHPPVDLAGALLAAARGLPSVGYGFGQHVERPMLEGFADRVRPLWQAAGLEPDSSAGLYRGVHLDPCPPSLQQGWCPPGTQLRNVGLPVPGDPAAALPPWVDQRGDRPLVYLGLGTVPLFNQPSAFQALLAPFGERDDLDVVATVSTMHDPAAVGPQPAHVHVERWLSLAALLPRCAAVVCHAGSGTTLAALTAGLPLVLCPQGADQFANAAACTQAGVARVVDLEHTADLPPALEALVAPGSPESAAARRVADEIAAMPTPHDVVAALDDLG